MMKAINNERLHLTTRAAIVIIGGQPNAAGMKRLIFSIFSFREDRSDFEKLKHRVLEVVKARPRHCSRGRRSTVTELFGLGRRAKNDAMSQETDRLRPTTLFEGKG